MSGSNRVSNVLRQRTSTQGPTQNNADAPLSRIQGGPTNFGRETNQHTRTTKERAQIPQPRINLG
eukprot:3020739-Prymnesium_polylepis.2